MPIVLHPSRAGSENFEVRVRSFEVRTRADRDPSRTVPFGSELWEDVDSFYTGTPLRRDTLAGRAWRTSRVLLSVAGARVVLLYRLGHALHHRGGAAGRLAAATLGWWSRHWYGCAISPEARLFGGLNLPHPQGIVIGPGVVVGRRAWVFHNVTIGPAHGVAGMPSVGRHARIYAGAVLVGPVRVGDHVQISANALVEADVPDGARVLPPRPRVAPLTGTRGPTAA